MTLQRFFILIATFLILACSSSSDNKGAAPFIDGTSDSGGGNGIENKAYEAYIVKPENLPAYKNIVAPKLKKILALSPIGAEKALPLFQRWVLYKTWYIAPVSLGTISKEVIGVSFSKDNTEQLAIQTKRSIWMNSTRFHQMSQDDQATLIIHEMVMSLYYLKYKTWEEISNDRLLTPQPLTPEDLEMLHELYPPTPLKPFDSDDYENIRTVTAGFLGEIHFNSAEEVDALLISKKFDPRFTFLMGTGDGVTYKARFEFSATSLTDVEFMRIVNSAELLGRTPNKCHGLRFQDPFDCTFSIRLIDVALKGGPKYLQNLLQVNSSNPAFPISFAGMTQFGETYHAGTIEFVDFKKRISTYILLSNPFPTSPVIGTKFYSVTMVFVEDLTQSNSVPTLLGLIAAPGVVIGTDAKNPRECSYGKPTVSSLQTDAILSYAEHLTDLEKKLLRAAAIRRPVSTTCIQY
jgi:hypothetical protein